MLLARSLAQPKKPQCPINNGKQNHARISRKTLLLQATTITYDLPRINASLALDSFEQFLIVPGHFLMLL